MTLVIVKFIPAGGFPSIEPSSFPVQCRSDACLSTPSALNACICGLQIFFLFSVWQYVVGVLVDWALRPAHFSAATTPKRWPFRSHTNSTDYKTQLTDTHTQQPINHPSSVKKHCSTRLVVIYIGNVSHACELPMTCGRSKKCEWRSTWRDCYVSVLIHLRCQKAQKDGTVL